MVLFGIVVSLGLIAVSVSLNFRMGFRSADTELDGKIYGAGAAFGDCLKAIAPFMMSWGARHRDWLAAGSAVALFSICTAYSFVSALGFAAEHRANKAGSAQVALDGYGDMRAQKLRLENTLAFYGVQRSAREVEDAIDAKLKERTWSGGRTVGVLSSNCKTDSKSTRAACEAVAKLNVELSAAREVERLNGELRVLQEKLSAKSPVAPTTADAQVDALVDLVNLLTVVITKDHVGLGLSILLACFIEVGSGVGLFMVTTPWRAKETRKNILNSKRLGHVDAYMLARIEPGEGMLSVKALHDDYVRWCLRSNTVAYSEAEFAKRFGAIANEAGLQITSRGQRDYCRQIRLAEG